MSEIRCPLKEAAHISMNQEALIGKDGAILYSEYEQCVEATSQLLRRAGCASGAGMAIALDPDWRLPVLLLAALRAGCRVCPLQAGIPAAHLRALLDTADCAFVVTDQPESPEIRACVLRPDALTGFTAPFMKGAFSSTPATQAAGIYFDLDGEGNRRALLFSYGNHYYSARGANERMNLRSGDRILLSAPPWRVESMNTIFRALLSGAALVVPGELLDIGSAVQKYGVTHLVITPAQHDQLAAGFEKGMYPSLKSVLVCGPVNVKSMHGVRVFNSFCLPEMGPFVSIGEGGASGIPLRFGEVKLSDKGGILVRGETLFMGYLDGRKVSRPTDADGWFETTYSGSLDEKGGLAVGGAS